MIEVPICETRPRLASHASLAAERYAVSAQTRAARVVARDQLPQHRPVVAGLTLRGIVAPFVLDGPINRDAFETDVTKVLVPALCPGDIVIPDNLSSHKGPNVRERIEAAGAQFLFLPPYGPDCNPIELAFAKLKALPRKAAERTVEGLWTAIGRILETVAPRECRNYFKAAGYDPT